MHVVLLAFLIGVIAGLRAFTAPTMVSWAAKLGWIPLLGTPFAFLGYEATPYLFTALALFELVNDKLPQTRSRKSPPQFIARIILGGFAGAAIGAGIGSLWLGLVLGAVGAVTGTVAGATGRAKLAELFDRDLPAALVEDAVAILGALLIVSHAQ
jgi:uncharacterized membrane protein